MILKDILLEEEREEKRKKEKEDKEYIKKHLLKINGCSSEFFTDFKSLVEKCKLSKFNNFTFEDDKIIYSYIDCYSYKHELEINEENLIFSIIPIKNSRSYTIMLKHKYQVTVEVPITDSNEKHLKEFYEKCKTYESKYATYFI